jgi:hypothetical protein
MNKLPIALIVFVLGLYYVTQYKNVESFQALETSQVRCPDMLIQEGAEFFLFNSKLTKVPGVNPLRFKNLEEYVQFTEWQRSQGIVCPILYLQRSYDAQNKEVYKGRPSPTNLSGGLPNYSPAASTFAPNPVDMVTMDQKLIDAGRDDLPFNKNSYPSFDPHDQDIGATTPLDKMFHEPTDRPSPNPMDTNWGGHAFTESLIKSGYYDDNQVIKRL